MLLASAASIAYGSRENDLREVIDVLRGGGDAHLQQVLAARWPRTVVGATVGASLAVSGVIIQGLTRNPLGEPGLLGVTTGASAAVVTAVAFFGFSATVGPATVLVALPGAIVVVVLVYVLSRSSGSQSVVPLILAGAVVSAVLTAYIQAMVLTRPQVFDSYRHWVVGSLAGAQFETLWAVLPAVILGLLLAVILAPGLNTLALGDEVAVSLGAPVVAIRAGGILAATLLAAAATAAVGPIAFIGLAAPHLVRSLVGGDFRQQVPVAILLGASLLLASDVVARVITRPEELMVGVVTAFLGAPFLLVAVRRGKVAV
ncbi:MULTISPECIES: FecCD family ABC transporter permease [Auritidibacter]|uniref:FecCD family ABC transporter permease n=1 Tax=Auritidibacter TaxID=1160973 RepID=UPI0016BCADB7|nr:MULTISPECIES: iron ABC transporter permease [Auritidibacter]NIH72697.1 iron complex transport system permease protein [Auritidibacter ignavus]WGH85559.1 iron ABC transporter permease [Auritidibacter ignavus]WHS36016.1 iron ABC transporter permease [Auritidibacter ignavus]